MKGLIKRLREVAMFHARMMDGAEESVCNQAADAIERLERERDEARSEVTRLRTIMRKEGLL